MYELERNIFWAIFTELFFVILAIILKEDNRKMIIVLIFGTVLAGIIGFGKSIFASNSFIASYPSYPSDALYFNEHYYKVFIYPSSVDKSYEATKIYATTTCNNLHGYVAVSDANSAELDFVWNLLSLSEKEHPGTQGFACEWNN